MTEHVLKQCPTPVADILKQSFLFEYELVQRMIVKTENGNQASVDPVPDNKDASSDSSKQINHKINYDMALRLSKHFNTSIDFWLDMQTDVETWNAIRNQRMQKTICINSPTETFS